VIVDEIKILLKAGDGGKGSSCMEHLSSRKMTGGGGNGGRGGGIIIRQNPHLYDLKNFRERKRFIADDGEAGKSSNKDGKNAKDLFIDVPKGTIVRDTTGGIIVDINTDEQQYLICRGGQGGEGNYRRDYTTPAGEGQSQEVVLDYRILNDIAILGFANSGKTSLFNALTGKDRKVADYPYTTTHCTWAISENNDQERFVVMDTPPLKKEKGAIATNKWLKHLYRTKIILLLTDNFSAADEDFSLMASIISAFDKSFLENKKVFYLLNKIDTIDTTPELKNIDPISVKTGKGLDILKEKLRT
jgi:GTP-binding protein